MTLGTLAIIIPSERSLRSLTVTFTHSRSVVFVLTELSFILCISTFQWVQPHTNEESHSFSLAVESRLKHFWLLSPCSVPRCGFLRFANFHVFSYTLLFDLCFVFECFMLYRLQCIPGWQLCLYLHFQRPVSFTLSSLFSHLSIASDSFSLKVFHSALFFFISSSISFFLLKLSHFTSVARVSNTRSVAKGLSLDITMTLIWTPLVRALWISLLTGNKSGSKCVSLYVCSLARVLQIPGVLWTCKHSWHE